MSKPNRWRDWVREWARKNNLSYACALTTTECKDQYRAKFGNPKRLTQKTERELMGAEDRNANIVYFTPVKRKRRKKVVEPVEEDNYPVPELVPFQNIIDENAKKQKFRENKERFGMSSEDLLSRFSGQAEKAKQIKTKGLANVRQKALESEMRRNIENKKQQLELSRMMGEDYRALPRPSLRVEEIEEEIPFPREARKKSKKKLKPILVIEEEAPKKQRGRPRKYSTKEEAYQAKIAQNRGYKQDQSASVKSIVEKMKEQAPKAVEEQEIIEFIPATKKKVKKAPKAKPVTYEPLEEAFPTASSVKKPMNIKVKPRQAPLERDERVITARQKGSIKRTILDYYFKKNPNAYNFKIKDKKKLKEAQDKANDLRDDYTDENFDNYIEGNYDKIDTELLELINKALNPPKRLYEPLEDVRPTEKDVFVEKNIKIKQPEKVNWKKSGYYKRIQFPPEIMKKFRKMADNDEWGVNLNDYFIMDDGTKIEVTRINSKLGFKSWEVSKLERYLDRNVSPPEIKWGVQKIGWFFTRWELHFKGPLYREGTGPQPNPLENEAFYRNTGKEKFNQKARTFEERIRYL